MRAGCHVSERGLHIGKAEHFIDHRLDRVRRDGAVHGLEHLRRADRNALHISAAAKDQRRIEFGGAAAEPADQRDFAADAFGQHQTFIDERNNITNLTYCWGPMKKLYTVTTHRDADWGGTEDQRETSSANSSHQ